MNGEFERFMKENDLTHVIGFSGGSDKQKSQVQSILSDSMVYLKNYPVAILTGGTCWGIPNYATEIAKDYGLKTIGVMPTRGVKYETNGLDLKLVAEPKFASSEYGDESEIFAKIVNGVEIIGGSAGTAIETFHILKINDRIIDYAKKGKSDEVPKIIAPIKGIAGFSSEIYKLGLCEKMPECMPDQPIYEGGDAAKFILNRLGLY